MACFVRMKVICNLLDRLAISAKSRMLMITLRFTPLITDVRR